MSPESVGLVKTIETIINISMVLGGGGVIFAILKLIPQKKESPTISQILTFSLKYVLKFSGSIFVIVLILANFKVFPLKEDNIKWLNIYSLIIVPSVLSTLLIRYYQAINQFKRISSLILLIKSVSAIIVVLSTFYFLLNGYIISMVITMSISFFALLFDVKRKFFLRFSEKDLDLPLKKEIISLSNQAFVAQIIDQLKLHSGFFIANYLILDRIDFGNYSFALILIQGFNIIATSVQQFVIPKISFLADDVDLLRKTLKKYEYKYFVVCVLFFLLGQTFGPFMIKLFFGLKYIDAIFIFRLMLVGWLIQGLFALKGTVFLGLGKMKYVTKGSFMVLLLSFPVAIIATSSLMGVGAAISFVFQQIVTFFILFYFVEKAINEKANAA